jgi:dienelactone hydrolase
MATTEPYGTWPSPVDAALAASHDGRPAFPGAVGDEVWWTASRPAENGRTTLVRRRADGTEETVLPAPWNVRTRVIEYGGLPWAGAPGAAHGPLVVFANFSDQRLYAYEPDRGGGAEPRPLTPVSATGGGLRWADLRLLPERGEVWCVLEEFTGAGPSDVRRVIAAVPLDGSAADDRAAVRELSDGAHRFVTGPEISPDGQRVAWLAWDHPRMPWDGTEVVLAHTGDGTGPFTGAAAVLGGPDESVAQVTWSADGALLYATDADGWWRLRRVAPEHVGQVRPPSRALSPEGPEEFGGPLWRLGLRWFLPLQDGRIAVVHGRGSNALGVLDPATGRVTDADGPWTEWSPGLAARGSGVIAVGAGATTSFEVVELDTATGRAAVIGSAHSDAVDPAYCPQGRERTFTGPGGREIHAHVYPPRHPDRTGPDGELPPYVIWVHGGPTSRTPLVLDLEIAYFTSRGIGVAKVNYGGSTGYGRAYRNRLREQWGIVDVEDCAAVALALAAEGSADRDRLAIRGGSAGGWTTAVSLTSSEAAGVYACGAISYPILDMTTWASGETHDFESQYLESLVGPFAEVPERYRDRSPISHVDRVTASFVLLQGLDDVICPPAQCERFLAAVEGRGIPHAYLAFEGEGHGFRKKETVVSCLEAELSLYAQTFGFERPDVPRLELKP